jgi:DNA-binding protein H-NS
MATTLEAMQAKIRKLQAQADALLAKKSGAVIEKIKSLMAEHGLTTADIDAHAGAKKRGPKPGAKAAAKSSASAAKYRDPKTGATWSGHGRAPGWIASAKDRSKFLVEGNAVSSAPAARKSAKADNYVRGPQPALYADPRTGATWSGRGRAPAWIANATDRRRFLIAGQTEAKAKPTTVVAKNAGPARKAAAKKSVPIVLSASSG